ncbi:MAG: hypothetical protein GX620_00310 [Chloroflexi bacterium]|nr:hypothetical protein [Chloroflexota bacterium]
MSARSTIKRREFLKGSAGVIGAGLLAGCAPSATPAAAPTTAPATAAPVATTAPAAATPVVTAPAVLKYGDKMCIHHHMTGGHIGPGPDDQLIIEIQQEALRNEYGLNVSIEFESAPWSDFDPLVVTRLETKACDSIERDGASALRWLADEGLMQDIESYCQEYGPHLADEFPQAAFDYFAKDGKRRAISNFYSTPVDCEFISIRRDWLDRIDRDVPQTIEDLEECLRLFKEKSLGGDVTIPISPELGGWLIPSYVLQGPFAPEPDEQLSMLENGQDFQYEHGCAMREERLELLQRWHRDGLLNPEWPTFKSEDNQAAVDKGIVGCMFCGWWATNGSLLTTEREIDPTQDWVQIYPPVSLKGRPETGRILTEVPLERTVVVTSWANCPEAIIAFCDWNNATWENYMLSMFGIEGKHWKWGDNGCYVDLRSNPPNQEYSGMCRVVWSPKWQMKYQTLPPCPDNMPKDPNITARIYGPHIYNRPQTNVPQANEYPTLTRLYHFVPWNWVQSAQFEPDLIALRDEYATKIIKGELEVTAGVREFWDQWMASGGDVRLQEITDQYAAYATQHPEMTDPKAFLAPESWNTTIEYPERPVR